MKLVKAMGRRAVSKPITLYDMPFEIFEDIVRHLPHTPYHFEPDELGRIVHSCQAHELWRILEPLRTVSKWLALASFQIFCDFIRRQPYHPALHTVSYTMTRYSLGSLLALSRNPLLAGLIQEVEYMSMPFPKELRSPAAFTRHMRPCSVQPSRRFKKNQYNTYMTYFLEHQQILDSRGDKAVLAAALPAFPNLHRLSFTQHVDSADEQCGTWFVGHADASAPWSRRSEQVGKLRSNPLLHYNGWFSLIEAATEVAEIDSASWYYSMLPGLCLPAVVPGHVKARLAAIRTAADEAKAAALQARDASSLPAPFTCWCGAIPFRASDPHLCSDRSWEPLRATHDSSSSCGDGGPAGADASA